MKYIDIHGHVNFPEYDGDREATLKRATDAGVSMITVGTDLETSRSAVELANKFENMYATVGTHPTSKEVIDIEAYNNLANDPKVVAIGECGLDYFRSDEGTADEQRKVFEMMIDLANRVNKPLMLHLRNPVVRGPTSTPTSAYKDAYTILKERSKVLGNLHFFAGSIEEAKPFLDLGYYFSFTGAITFGNNYEEIIKYIPINRIMSETDCPFVAPIPYRGKRNEPAYVIEVVKTIAKIKGQSEEVVREQVLKNAETFLPRSDLGIPRSDLGT